MLQITEMRKKDPAALDKPENVKLKARWEGLYNARQEKRRLMYDQQFVSSQNKSPM